MHYRKIQPPKNLASVVRYYWILEGGSTEEEEITFRVLADGYPGFIFTWGNDFFVGNYSSTDSPSQIPQCFFYGVSQHYQDMSVHGNFGIFGLSFYPQSLSRFGLPAGEIVNNSLPIEYLYQKEGKQLKERMQNAVDHAERLRTVNNFLMSFKRSRSYKNVMVRESISEILSSNGTISIANLLKPLDISRRHYERTFRATMGISPKRYSRIIRFQHAIRQSGDSERLTDLAFHFGYSDQSHFSREFKLLSGFSPRNFFSVKTEEVVESFVKVSE